MELQSNVFDPAPSRAKIAHHNGDRFVGGECWYDCSAIGGRTDLSSVIYGLEGDTVRDRGFANACDSPYVKIIRSMFFFIPLRACPTIVHYIQAYTLCYIGIKIIIFKSVDLSVHAKPLQLLVVTCK